MRRGANTKARRAMEPADNDMNGGVDAGGENKIESYEGKFPEIKLDIGREGEVQHCV